MEEKKPKLASMSGRRRISKIFTYYPYRRIDCMCWTTYVK